MGLPLRNLSGEPSDGPTEAKLNRKRVEEVQEPAGADWFRAIPGPELFMSWRLGELGLPED